MLADGMPASSFVRAPLVSNEALFDYLELPPFRKEEWIRSKQAIPLTRKLDNTEKPFTPFTLLRNTNNEPEMSVRSQRESVKSESRESRKRVKGPHDEVILGAMDALLEDEQPLTLNAIARRADLTWRKYDDIEEVASYYGYDLERGSGRPAKEAYR